MARRLVFLLLWLGSAWPAAAVVTPGTSTAQNPKAAFATPGTKQVTLKACNLAGCTTVVKTVTVLDPNPVIDQALVGGTLVTAGQLVRLSGIAHGRLPMAYTWKVLSLGPEVDVAGGSAWWDTSGMPPGTYAVSLVVQNADNTASSVPVPVVVTADAGTGFYTLAPCRVLDTRAGAPLAGSAQVVIPVAGAAACGIPASAKAVAVNVTVVSPTTTGNLALYPGNYPRPPISTINFMAGQTRANNAVLALASDATGSLAATAALGTNGTVHLIVDVDGYFQ